MANTIKLKRSSVAGKVPLISDLDYGEVSINYTDGTLYYKDSSGSINAIGSNIGNTVVSGNITANTAGTRATFANVITTQGIFWANGVNYSTGLGGGSSFSGGIVTSSIYPTGNVALNLGTDTAFWGTTFTGNLTANVVIASGVNLLSNVGSLANSIYTLDANVGAYELYANANVGTIKLNLSSLDANVGAYEIYANANIGSIYNSLNTLDANIGAYEIYANANVGTIKTNLSTLDANVGAYEIYANANIGTITTHIGNIVTNANANTAAYLAQNDITIANVITASVNSLGASSHLYMTDIGLVSIAVAGQEFKFGGSGIESSPGLYGGAYGGNKLSLNNETNLISNRYDIVKIQTGTDGSVQNTWDFSNSSMTAPGRITALGNIVANSGVASTSNVTGALVVTGGAGITGDLYVQSNIYSAGSRTLTAADLETVTITANYITMDPNLVPVSNVGAVTSIGTYNFGNIADIQIYGDHDTVANTGFYSVNDAAFSAGPPGHIEYIGFTNVDDFNRLVLNINYTQNSGHTQTIDIYNYTDDLWDTFATYSGTGGWQNFTLGVISSVPYISNTGNVTVRNYHLSAGSSSHRTWIDYVALEKSVTGGQGPRGTTGATGATGAAGAGIATGGTAGQVLIKNSSTDYDTAWTTAYGNSNVATYLASETITSNIATTANILAGNIQTTGKVYVGDITNAVPYVMGSGAFHVAGGMSIAKDFWIGGNLYVANIISQSTTILEVSDPLVYLNSDSPTYNYDIGIFSQFVNPDNGLNNYTGAIRSYIHNYWGFFSNVTAKPAGGAVDFADPGIVWDTVKAGDLIVGNATPSTSYASGALRVAGGAGIAGAVNIGGNLTVVGNLTVQGNTITIGSNNLTVSDSIIDLHTPSDLSTLITDDGRDIGFRFHYYKGSDEHAFFGWENDAETLIYLQQSSEINSNITGTPGNVKFGSLMLSNTTTSTSTASGALVVNGGAGIAGALYINNTGDVSANIGAYQTYANANAATQATSINTINANIGAFYTYANTKIGNNSNGNLVVTASTESTSTTTGALVVAGGVGVGGNIWAGDQLRQDSAKVAIGNGAGATDQHTLTVAIGDSAGFLSQCACAIAIGASAGRCSQGAGAIAIGQAAGYTCQGIGAIAIGASAGQLCGQGACAVAVGSNAGKCNQGANAVAVGAYAGSASQNGYGVAVGDHAGYFCQSCYAVAVGSAAGRCNQSASAVAVGNSAGNSGQQASAVAVGNAAGNSGQSSYGIAIGYNSGHCIQGSNAIAIGRCAGFQCQRTNTVAIGYNAGQFCQGACAVAIGRNAGVTSQVANSIAINASGTALDPTNAGFYVDPIRGATAGNVVVYDTTTKELTYTTLPTGITYTASTSAPASPSTGDQWYNTTTNILYEYITDGTTSFWLDIQSPVVTANVPAGTTSLIIQDEGSSLVTTPNTINFVGAGVTATNSGNVVTVSVNTPDTISPFLLMGA